MRRAHAFGPMQFLPATWARWGTVAPRRPPGAVPSVHSTWGAIYSAAAKLCGGRERLADVGAAILAYNRSKQYLDQVMAKAAEYGLAEDHRIVPQVDPDMVVAPL